MVSLKKIITLFFLIHTAQWMIACTGTQPHILEELHKTANGKSVFVVVIDSVSPNHSQGFKSFGTVLEVFKGSVGKKIAINSGGFTSAGGQFLIPHQKYLVFADLKEDVFTAFICDDLSTNLYPSDTKDDMEKEKNDLYNIAKQWYKLHTDKYTGSYEYKINGNVAASGQYKDGIANGQWLYYKKYDVRDYKLYAKINYKNGAMDGEVHRWHSSFSFKEEESTYKNDVLIARKLYAKFPKKNVFYLLSETSVETLDGQKIEHFTSFDTALQILKKYDYLYTGINFECPFFSLTKVLHGPYYSLHASSKEKTEGQYVKGKKVGLWKTTAKDGRTIKEVNFGVYKQMKDSLIVEFNENSYYKGKIKNNQPIGTWIVKEKDGNYHASVPIENGTVNGWVIEQRYSDYLKEQYKNGLRNGLSYAVDTTTRDTSRITEYENGKKHGKEKYFHSNRKLRSLAHFDRGLQTGSELMYDENGALLSQANYVEDMKHGPYEAYDSRFGLKDKGMYFHGLRAGSWIEKYAGPINYFIVRTKKEQFYKSIPESYIAEYENDAEYEVLRNIK